MTANDAMVPASQPADELQSTASGLEHRRSIEPDRREALLAAIQSPTDLARLVGDLADDKVRWNANRAYSILLALGVRAWPGLERALLSRDYQQRHLAAIILRRQVGFVVTDELFRVTVEGLGRKPPRAKRGLPEGRMGLRYLAQHGTRYLLRRPGARRHLERGLDGEDSQRRFLSAFILAWQGNQQKFWPIIDALLPHLEDNQIAGDGLMAAHALYRLGPAVIPFLDQARATASKQSRQLLHLIEQDLLFPPRTRRALRARSRQQSVTQLYHDPVLEFDPWRSTIATW